MGFVTLTELADEFGLDRSNTRKYVLGKGFEPFKIRTAESRGQLTLALSKEDAAAVREVREQEGFSYDRIVLPEDNGTGSFYIIQIVPDLDPLRIKLGFSSNVEARLAAYQTAAPNAKIAKVWLCKRVWEHAAIASITHIGCELIKNEVFTCDDIEKLIVRGDMFFSLMPDLNS